MRTSSPEETNHAPTKESPTRCLSARDLAQAIQRSPRCTNARLDAARTEPTRRDDARARSPAGKRPQPCHRCMCVRSESGPHSRTQRSGRGPNRQSWVSHSERQRGQLPRRWSRRHAASGRRRERLSFREGTARPNSSGAIWAWASARRRHQGRTLRATLEKVLEGVWVYADGSLLVQFRRESLFHPVRHVELMPEGKAAQDDVAPPVASS